MVVEILVHTFDHAKALKGTPQHARDGSQMAINPWGVRETLPNFVIFRFVDANKVDVNQFLVPWKNKVIFSIQGQDAIRRRWRLEVAPNVITEFGEDRGISAEMVAFLKNKHAATVVTRAPDRTFAILDVPNTDFQFIEDSILDKFEVALSPRRFRFSDIDVDAAISAGGRLITNSAPVLNRIIDREQ